MPTLESLEDSERWPPTRCDMPDLSSLETKNLANHMLNLTFSGRGRYDGLARLYVPNLARLVDKSIREYELARGAFQAYVAGDSLLRFFEAMDHLETCVDCLKRAIRFLERLKADPGTALGKNDLPRPIETELITNARDAIQHTDRLIREAEITEGEPVMLLPLTDAIRLGSYEISYADLATIIRKVEATTVGVLAAETEGG